MKWSSQLHTYSIPEDSFSNELWISKVPGATGLLCPQTLPGEYLKLNSKFNSQVTIAKRCKSIGRPHRDRILEWARLNPEKISFFLDQLAADPKWQILFRGVYDSLRLLYLRLFNVEARTVRFMEHRMEQLLSEERICLEHHEKELAVRGSQVLYLESVMAEQEFAERTQWQSKLPPLPKWPSWRKSNKKRPRVPVRDEPNPKRKCSMRSKVAGTFTFGTTAALIRESFPKQKGVVVSETAPVPENLFNMSLNEILSDVEWEPTVEEILTPEVSLVVGDLVEDPGRLEPCRTCPERGAGEGEI